MDLSVEPFDEDKAARASFVGISVPMHTALRLGVRAAQRVREVNRKCHICLYGLYAVLNSEHLLGKVADSVIGGEYEAALVDLVRDLEASGPGRGMGVIRPGGAGRPILRRLSFAAPLRAGLPPLEKYASLEHGDRLVRVGSVEASRGCLHSCRHCPIPPVYGGKLFIVPRDVVLEDVRQLVRSGAGHITYGDPDFLNGPGHSMGILRAAHSEFPHLTFDFTAKVEHILRHRRLLPELRDLGCSFVVSATESLSDTVLHHLQKGHARRDIFEVLEVLGRAGIPLRPTWVPFTPWTSLEDYLDILEFVEQKDLVYNVDAVQFSIRLLIPPGSLLLESPGLEIALGPLDGAAFFYPWTHPDPRMDDLEREVGARVEEAASRKEDPRVTFRDVQDLARSAMGDRRGRPGLPSPGLERRSVPRLTEAWFC